MTDSNDPPTRYREIEVSGTPLEMGRGIGEAASEEIRGFVEIAMERVNLTTPVSNDKAMQVAANCISYVEDYSPHMLEELRGMSEAAGVSVEDLMMLQVRNQLRPEDDAGCTSFSVGKPASGPHLIGQNWDNDPGLDLFTIVLTRRPEGKPALMNITQAGLIAYIGLNDAGIGICLNTLPAPSREAGVPHYFQVRGMYEADNLDDAVMAVRRANRAIPANIMMATQQGPADIEVTLDNVHVLRDDAGVVTHTNHCLHPDLLPINDDFPELIESHPRLTRIDRLLSEAGSPSAVENMKSALSDHDNYPRSICRHQNDDPGTGYWMSVFSVIIETEAGLMHVSRGNPCCRPYETYRLN